MRTHTVELGDKSGHSFKIEVSMPSYWARWLAVYTGGDTSWGGWRSIDKGFIRYHGGKAERSRRHYTGTDLTTANLYLYNMDGKWGIQLFDYDYSSGTNDAGEGNRGRWAFPKESFRGHSWINEWMSAASGSCFCRRSGL